MKEERVIWWLKKDFRLADNPALTQALAEGQEVLPLFIIEPSALDSPETSARHLHSWLDAVRELRRRIRKAGGELCVLHGEVLDLLPEVQKRAPFSTLISHQEIGIERTFARDRAVQAWCRENNITWHQPRQTGVFRALEDRDERAKRWQKWTNAGPLPEPAAADLARLQVPDKVMVLRSRENRRLLTPKHSRLQPVSESAAAKTLATFLQQRSKGYSTGISSPNTAFFNGSRLSVHLAWGTITGRHVYQAVQDRLAELKLSDDPDAGKWRRSLSSYLARLNWRDHFIQRLESEPRMEFQSLNVAYDDLPFDKSDKTIAAWQNGATGFPLVDASIRCAQATGFMNFRMRCMMTSLACHGLQMDWRDLDYTMARWWTDYEPGIHLSQLQMQAGVVGINTLRTYNPAKQIADHDPDAKFVKRWLPELKNNTPQEIIDHQEKPLATYLAPIVNRQESTAQMRSNYYRIKAQPRTKELAEAVYQKHGSRKRPPRKNAATKKAKKAA